MIQFNIDQTKSGKNNIRIIKNDKIAVAFRYDVYFVIYVSGINDP